MTSRRKRGERGNRQQTTDKARFARPGSKFQVSVSNLGFEIWNLGFGISADQLISRSASSPTAC